MMPPRILAAILLAALAETSLAQPRVDRDIRDDILYHYMPIAWRDSDNDAYRYGDFGGMTASLDYLEDLGVTGVWMNPIFPSPAYHGYQHGPADQVNSRLGTRQQFLDFVAQAHAREMKVFVDLVVYGISHSSTYYQSAYNNPSSPYDSWLAFTNTANTEYQGYTFTTWNNSTVGFIFWNLNTPAAAQLVTNWSVGWLDPNNDGDPSDGIDGYRLDHVWENYPAGPNGWGYNIDDFWTPWKAALRAVNPSVFTFAEQADWGSHGAELLPAHDATLSKPFQSAARGALSSENAAGLYAEVQATLASLPADRTYMGTIGDHDVDRITTALGGGLDKAKVAAAILMTQPFPPMIYFGDEIGMLGAKANCFSDASDIPMREPFKWNAVDGPPMSNYWVQNLCAIQNRYSQNNDGRSVAEQNGAPGSLLETYRTLIAARKANVALRRGAYYPVTASNTHVWAFTRLHDEQDLLIAINLGGTIATGQLNFADYGLPVGGTTPVDVLTGQSLPTITSANQAAYPLTLPIYGFRILSVSLSAPGPSAAPVDGREIPTQFGQPQVVATQNNATGLGDNVSELDQLFVRTRGPNLWLGLTGNVASNSTGLALFFDVAPGGQNQLDFGNSEPPPAAPLLGGLRFDIGFSPDQLVFMNNYQSTIYVDQYRLLTNGGVTKTYRGRGTVNDGDGYLAGGTNPNAMQYALDNTNVLGVTDASAAAAATATAGAEIIVPLADLSLPATYTGTIKLAAFLMRSNGSVSNQWLPGLGGGFANPGVGPDMTTIPGDQYAAIAVVRPGDCDCDGVVDFFDIDPFVLGLSSPAQYASQFPNCPFRARDVDGSGVQDFFDIDPFVTELGR